MAEYIEREAVKAKKVYDPYRHENVVPVAEIDWLPAADVTTVVHGRWIEDNDGDGRYCSVCGTDYCYMMEDCEKYLFCPNCGAKMDLEGE